MHCHFSCSKQNNFIKKKSKSKIVHKINLNGNFILNHISIFLRIRCVKFYIASMFHTLVLQSCPVEINVTLSNHTNRVICDCGWASKEFFFIQKLVINQ